MPNDRSESALRERLELARKATPEGERTLWTVDPAVRGDLCIRDAFNERILTMEDGTATATARHIATSSPDVVREDIEEILRLRGRVKRLDKEVDWLIEYIWNRDIFRCPMPEDHKCEQRYGILCCLDLSETEIRRRCWRYVANMATRINPGNSRKSREEETA